MKKFPPFLFCIILSLVSCGKPKPDVYLFRNNKYFTVFKDKQQVYLQAERFFNKSGYTVRPVTFAKFGDLSKECDVIKNRTKTLPNGAIFFMDNLETSVFVNNLNSYNSANYKIVTYNYDVFAKDSIPSQTLLNFYPSNDVIYNAIVQEFKRVSKAEDYSDTVYIHSSAYPLTASIAERLKKEYPAVKLSNISSKSAVKNAVNSNNKSKCFIVFAFEYNIGITDLDIKTLQDKTIVEVMSNYGETYSQINRSILLDETILVEHALHSKQLSCYLEDKEIISEKRPKTDNNTKVDKNSKANKNSKSEKTAKTDKNSKSEKNAKSAKNTTKAKTPKSNNAKKNVTNIELKQNNIFRTITHYPQKESLGVKLEEYIKEREKEKNKNK